MAEVLAVGEGNSARVLVFIPSLGDVDALPGMLGQIAELGPQFRALILDDGSAPAITRPAGAPLFASLPANLGLGVCTGIAIDHAIRHGYGGMARVDGDGQHAIADIPRLLAPIRNGTADLVLGVRVNRNATGPLGRRLVRNYFNAMAGLLTSGAAPADVNSGFFVAGRKAMTLLSRATFERFPEPEMVVTACRGGLRVAAVDVEQNQRAGGDSTLDPVAAALMLFRFHVFALGELLRGKAK